MRNRIRRFFLFYIKSLQFRFATWKRSREIARAYHTPPAVHIKRDVLRYVIGCAAALLVIAGIILNAPKLFEGMKTTGSAMREALLLRVNRPRREPQIKPAPAQKMAEAAQQAQNTTGERPAVTAETTGSGKSLLNLQEPMRYCIVANKATKTLYLLHRQEDAWKIQYTFSMAIGKNEGPKKVAGDNKTPEGTYFVIGRKDRDELSSIYGPLAYVLNYPNEEDAKAGRTGQGIWVHGTAPDSQPLVSRGCLKLDNNNLWALAVALRLGIGTPVIITNQPTLASPLTLLNPAELQVSRERILHQYAEKEKLFMGMLTAWKTAWESRDIEAYSRFYNAADFSGEGMKWNAWQQRKRSIFQNNRSIAIRLQNIVVTDCTDTTAVVKFVQEYVSTGVQSENGKKLYCVKNGAEWKISRENTFPKEELTL